ncbi:MAG TPA: NAD(P)H-binding protein, partial [Hyphomicrobiales bacterium]|nr:NAD(P)H-binding protein [Hyphomicrobiales bacterium]
MKLCLTGANSSVGRTLLQQLAGREDITVLALSRSPQANALPQAANVTAMPVAYEDHDALTAAFAGAQAVVHLAGVLFASKGASYQSANVDSTAAVVRAAQEAGVPRLVFVSVLGADSASRNPFYRSKGQAENCVMTAALEATVLRTPLLLGPLCAGGQALLREARSGTAKLLGGGQHRVRPLDVDDLCAALVACCTAPLAGAR